MRRTLPAVILLPLLLVTTACGGNDNGSSIPLEAQGVDQVVRQVLTSGASQAAPGQALELTRVIVPARSDLAAHVHPGPQLAYIAYGVLTFSVIDGHVELRRRAGTPDETFEIVASGQTIDLHAGDAITEPQGVVHSSRNTTDEPVVIYISSLFPEGAPASMPVN